MRLAPGTWWGQEHAGRSQWEGVAPALVEQALGLGPPSSPRPPLPAPLTGPGLGSPSPHSHSSLRFRVRGSWRGLVCVLSPTWSSCTAGGHISSLEAPSPGSRPDNSTVALSLQETRAATIHAAGGPPQAAAPQPTHRAGSYWEVTGGFCFREPWVQCLPPLI